MLRTWMPCATSLRRAVACTSLSLLRTHISRTTPLDRAPHSRSLCPIQAWTARSTVMTPPHIRRVPTTLHPLGRVPRYGTVEGHAGGRPGVRDRRPCILLNPSPDNAVATRCTTRLARRHRAFLKLLLVLQRHLR